MKEQGCAIVLKSRECAAGAAIPASGFVSLIQEWSAVKRRVIPLTPCSAVWMQEGDESYPLFVKERGAILDSLKKRAKVSNGCAGQLWKDFQTQRSLDKGVANVSRKTLDSGCFGCVEENPSPPGE